MGKAFNKFLRLIIHNDAMKEECVSPGNNIENVCVCGTKSTDT